MDDRNPEDIIEETVDRIEGAAAAEQARSKRLRWSNSVFSFAAAILGVGAPALVTYFAQSPNGSSTLKVVAILSAAFAGATTVLLNTFRWGQRYGQSSLAAISLRELASSTRLRLHDIKRTTNAEAIPEKLHLINHESQKQMFDILRSVVQNEAAIFSKSPEVIGTSAPSTQKELNE
jgi:hypothetical protein